MTNIKIQNVIVGIFAAYKIFAENYIPTNLHELVLKITTIVGIVLLLNAIVFLFFDTTQKKLKSFQELTSKNNFSNYFQIWILLLTNSFDVFHPIGSILYLTFTISFLIFCIGIIITTYIRTKDILSAIIIGHIFFTYCLFSWSKSTYVKYYGNEVIGSYWERPNHETRYLLKLYHSNKSNDYYTLPGLIHVYSETSEDNYPSEDGFGQEYYKTFKEKHILLEKVFFKDGGYLTFEECELEIGRKRLCFDQNEREWYIELTNKRME